MLMLFFMGLFKTIILFLGSAIIAVILGTIFGIFCSRYLKVAYFTRCLDIVTFILRGIPFYVQLLIFYFVLPEIIGINLSPEISAIMALGICSSAYVTQIVKAGINSINIGQWEASFVLGYNKSQALRFIILPQMLKNILPAFINEFDYLVKSTSIISSIGVIELTRVGLNYVSRGYDPITIYLSVAGFYLIISSIFYFVGKRLERKLNYDQR